MRIPEKLPDKERFLDDLIQSCNISQIDRLNVNTALRNYTLFGSDYSTSSVASYNKIWPTLQLLSSFLYAQETVNFSVKWGIGVPEEQTAYGETLRRKAHEIWGDTGADLLFGEAVFWALAYASCFVKVIWNGGLRVYFVKPEMIGVYREDIPAIDNQEAITHLYYSTVSNLRTMTKVLGESRQNDILERVSTIGPIDNSVAPETVTQMILNSQIPNVKGAVNPVWESRYQYRPQTSPDLVEMKEVWVYDDEREDYRVFTVASDNVVIFDREGKDLCTKGEHPFIKITPFPLPDYFWGLSLTQSLLGLQDWHDGHLKRVDVVYRRKLRPSRAITGPGWGQLSDEKLLALDREGGMISSPVPGAKVDTYTPEIPMQEAIAWLHELDAMFNETAGLGANIMRAEGDEGVRSMQHAQVLQRMGSSRIKRTALAVEDPAEKLATIMMKMQREHDKNKYLDENNKEFYLSQTSSDFSIKVSGHSLSPVFIEDTKQEAKFMLGSKIMTREGYINETQPPMAEEIKHELKTKVEPAEAKAAQVQQGLALLKAGKGKI